MNARNRVFILLGILALIALGWYFFSTQHSDDLQLIGTVDANEVVVSSRIPGRIQTLTVDEGDDVKVGQLIATIEAKILQRLRMPPRRLLSASSTSCRGQATRNGRCEAARPAR